jgi:hypothetical protein
VPRSKPHERFGMNRRLTVQRRIETENRDINFAGSNAFAQVGCGTQMLVAN